MSLPCLVCVNEEIRIDRFKNRENFEKRGKKKIKTEKNPEKLKYRNKNRQNVLAILSKFFLYHIE